MIGLRPNRIPVNRKANGFIVGEFEVAGFRLVKTARATPGVADDRETTVTNAFFERPC